MLIIDLIRNAQTITLSTHKNSDGDGLGSEIAMYFALMKINKSVTFYHSDIIPDRYHFLSEKIPQNTFVTSVDEVATVSDLILIFDTHDPKLCSPLYEKTLAAGKKIFFIDHHVETDYQTEKNHLLVDESASCTGEIVFDLIKKLNIPLDENIASSLYASLIFDTQNFKLIRDTKRPFSMASELLAVGFDHEKIQKQIFANWNMPKMNYLAYLISQVQFFDKDSIAVIKILKNDLKKFNVEADQISDLVDLFMSIDSISAAIVIREETANYHKLSFRSRPHLDILNWARLFNGGGHRNAAGAWVEKNMPEIEMQLKDLFLNHKLI